MTSLVSMNNGKNGKTTIPMAKIEIRWESKWFHIDTLR